MEPSQLTGFFIYGIRGKRADGSEREASQVRDDLYINNEFL